MAGRPPKPTALKILHGNPGRHPLNKDEPKPVVGAEPPAYFREDPVLMAEWTLEAPRLTRLGILTEIDADTLARLCVLRVRFRDQLASGASANALSSTSKELRSLELQFGMGAANRARVKVKPDEKEQTKLGRYVG